MPMRVGGLLQTLGNPPEVGDKPPQDADPSVKEAWREQMLARDNWRTQALDAGYDPQTILAATGATGTQGGGGLPWLNALREQAYYGKSVDTGKQYDWVNGRYRQMAHGGYGDWQPIPQSDIDAKNHQDAIRGSMSQAEFERSAYNINPGEGWSLLDSQGGGSHGGDFGGGTGNWSPDYWTNDRYFAPDNNTRSGADYQPGPGGEFLTPPADGNFSAAYGSSPTSPDVTGGGSIAPAPTYATPINAQIGPTANNAPTSSSVPSPVAATSPTTSTSIWGQEYNDSAQPSPSYSSPSPTPSTPTAQQAGYTAPSPVLPTAKKQNIGGVSSNANNLPTSSGYAF